MHRFQLYYQSVAVTSLHFKMDAMEERALQAPMFRKSKLLYLYCVHTEYIFELTVLSLAFLELNFCLDT